MEESELLFNFFYILMSICIVYPPTEFISLGFTIDQIFANFLGDEHINFIRYHQRRTSLTLAIHSSLPAIYFIIHYLKFETDDEFPMEFNIKIMTWKIGQRISIAAAILVITFIAFWIQDNWRKHPISKQLLRFSNRGNGYESVANNVADEFRRNNVLNLKINAISSVIATENWVMKTMPYFVHFAHQSDTTLEVNKTDTFTIAQDSSDSIQMIDIIVKSQRCDIKPFQIRINALDFKTLQDRISRPITIPPTISFHRNIIDRFIEVFKEQVSLNPKYRTNQASDTCFACMVALPNVKIIKQCLDVDINNHPLTNDVKCRDCYCQPMWCVDCLARWFASRQGEFERDVWLQKKCTCPLCRAKFCLLDVCYIENNNDNL